MQEYEDLKTLVAEIEMDVDKAQGGKQGGRHPGPQADAEDQAGGPGSS